MLTSEVFQTTSPFSVIIERCSNFIQSSGQNPLIKNLPKSYSNCQRVKVRKRKPHDYISTTFNEAFDDRAYDIRQRSIFANGTRSFVTEQDSSTEPFYVFPINGFKFLYNKKVNNSTDNYKGVFHSVIEQFGHNDGTEMLTDVLRFAYTSDKLAEGIASGSEIILYNIPYYYAARVSNIPSYETMLQQ